MSSLTVRGAIKTFLTANFPGETLIDITNQFDYLDDLLDDNGLTERSDWLGLQFIGETEEPITVGAGNDTGLYREFGSFFLHFVTPARRNTVDALLARAEAVRNGLRGIRLGDLIVIESVFPPDTEPANNLQFDDGFTSCAVVVNFYYDLTL